MSRQDYLDGWRDGKADLDPAVDRLAYGANRLNDYERGYVDAGQLNGPVEALEREQANSE